MQHKFIYVFILLIFNTLLNRAQIVPISKKEALENGIKNNYRVKIAKENFNIAKGNFKQSNAVFLPTVSISHTGIATTNPLMAFGSKLNQEILTQSDFNPALLNNPKRIQSFATKIEVQQPLINIDGFYKRKAAQTKMEAFNFKAERTKDYLELEVNKAYMQLQLTHKAVEVLKKALETANANKKLAQNVFRQGYMQKSDLLAVEVHLTEIKNQLSSAENEIANASNYLSFLMNKNENIIYKPTDKLTVKELTNENVSLPNTRSDIKAMELVTKAYEKMHKAEKMAFLPRLNAFGSFELYDDKIFQTNANGYLVGVKLSWDVFKGSQRFGKLQKSKAEYEKSKLEYQQYISKSNLELNKANRMLKNALNKLTLNKLAVKQSKEALRIRKNRFKEGLEKSTDLLISETKYAQKQLEYYQTVFEYNYAKAYVAFLTKK